MKVVAPIHPTPTVWIRTSPHQSSFIILNLEDNETLRRLDRDNDYLNDYVECYKWYTSPFDSDTDNDGATDYEEVVGALHGYTNSDPNDYTDNTDYRCRIFVDAGGPYIDMVGEEIVFNGNACGGTQPYEEWWWDFGDGNESDEQDTSHVYGATGSYSVKLTVVDQDGYSDFGFANVSIYNFSVEIQKPKDAFYFHDEEILAFPSPVAIGELSLEVSVLKKGIDIKRVEFYLDEVKVENDTSEPYGWLWSDLAFFKHTIEVVAVDEFGKEKSDECNIWKFF